MHDHRKLFKQYKRVISMETITIPKQEFEQMKRELTILRDSKIYQRLLQFEKSVAKKKYTRQDLGF